MTTRLKLGIGLGFIVCLLGIFTVTSKNALAAGFGPAKQQQINGAQLKYINASTIEATFPAIAGTPGTPGGTVLLRDSDPGDDNREYVSEGEACQFKVKIDGGEVTNPANNSPSSAVATLSQVGSGFLPGDCAATLPVANIKVTQPLLSKVFLTWIDKNHVQVIHNSKIFVRDDNTPAGYFLESLPGGPIALNCVDGIWIEPANNKNALAFEIDIDNGPTLKAVKKHNPAASALVDRITGAFGASADQVLENCNLQRFNFRGGDGNNNSLKLGNMTSLFSQARIYATNLANATKEPTADSASASDNSCEGQNNTGLEWILCSVLRSINAVVDKIDAAVNDQLEFNVKQNLQDPAGIKQAWTSIRNIATAILVILLLVMVMAQALGGGPFDAYTIRKLLPRVVAAVILMQISWDLFIWVIQIVNDIGNGMRDLLAAPFGGYGSLSLDKLIGGLGVAAPGAVLFLGLSAATLALIINPFGVLMLAFVVLLAVFMALAVLLFRTVLIIACVIFAPVALAAWILPGTERYWKLWWNNFTKVLFLFPLIIAMIVSGRIFAFIVAGKGGSPGLLDLFAIVIGYFGPYFILPKAFKWGGQIMAAAGGAISNNALTKSIGEKGRSEIKGMGERYQGEGAKQYNPSASRGMRTLRRIQSGSFLPTERSRRLTIAKGDKWKAERNDEAAALVGRRYEMAMSNGYVDGTGKTWEAGVGAAKQALVDVAGNDGTSDADKRAAQAATKQLLDTNSWIEIQNSTISTGKNAGKRVFEMPTWESTLTTSPQHYSATIGKRPDLVPHMLQYTYSTGRARDLFADDFAGIDPNDGAANEAMANSVYAREGITRRAKLSDSDRMIMAINEQMGDTDFASVAQGFYQEIDRLGDPRVSGTLRGRLEQIERTGLPGQQILSHMSGGSLAKDVNNALAHESVPSGGSRTIESFIPGATPPPAPQQPQIITPGSSEFKPPTSSDLPKPPGTA